MYVCMYVCVRTENQSLSGHKNTVCNIYVYMYVYM